MITFGISILIVLSGYFFYSKKVEKIFGVDTNKLTPAYRLQDGVDFIPMSKWKAFLIEFLDIAGLGPIFGAILGAAYGPVALIWIVVGGILGGCIHDYFSGMMSVRENGNSIAEVIGKWMGLTPKQFMRVFTLLLMILVGASFMMGPAKILANLTGTIQISQNFVVSGENLLWFWVIIILVYYFLATLLPIDKIIGRFYPLFGLSMLLMALEVGIMIFVHGSHVPELTFNSFKNMHSQSSSHPIFPLLFITISCGAISGFHSTQSPLMARTIKNEKDGRLVFWGAMTAETIVALIWATAAMTFFDGVGGLNNYLAQQGNNSAPIVTLIANSWLGKIGAVLAILGVVAAPITSGDTALRSARLIIADFLKLKQNSIKNRIIITMPIFIVAFSLTFMKFDALWRLMFWFNQLLATIVLWGISIYLLKNNKLYIISLIPAIFMTAVVFTYLFVAKEALGLPAVISNIIGLSITTFFVVWFFIHKIKVAKNRT